MHCVEGYNGAITMAVIADRWSHELDKNDGYNMDAFITISSSLRKYIKFEDGVGSKELPLNQINIEINEDKYQRELADSEYEKRNVASLSTLLDKLNEFAKKGHLKSKAELVKWRCLYYQEPELLETIKGETFFENLSSETEASNCQLRFMDGLLALRTEKYEEAIDIFTELLEKNQKEMQYIRLVTLGLKTRYLFANCYMSRAEFAEAEKILRKLHDTLAAAKKSRKSQGVEGSTDAETDARVEIDLGYCCMQRGAYEEAVEIYKNMYGDGTSRDGKLDFGLQQVKRQRRIMGLNNYASSCIFSIDDEENVETSRIKEKIEIARRIFCYMDTHFSGQDNKKEVDRYEWNPETNLLKGYYTLCTGIEPGPEPVTDAQVKMCQNISETAGSYMRSQALLKAFPYFRKACRFEEAFTSRYDLLDEQGRGNRARYRNEVERISVYIISLTKLQKLYLSKRERIEELNDELKDAEGPDSRAVRLGENFEITKRQLEYLNMSRRKGPAQAR